MALIVLVALAGFTLLSSALVSSLQNAANQF
jgi:hypothetical protein